MLRNRRTRSNDPPSVRNSLFPVSQALYQLAHVDAFEWLEKAARCSIHAVVTDPPYGLVEFTPRQLEKMRKRSGGVWRIPPSFDGCRRNPLPRFTVLTP